jgi:hypothetical protein
MATSDFVVTYTSCMYIFGIILLMTLNYCGCSSLSIKFCIFLPIVAKTYCTPHTCLLRKAGNHCLEYVKKSIKTRTAFNKRKAIGGQSQMEDCTTEL